MICRRFTEISEDSNYCIMMKKRKMKSFSIIISLFTLLHLLLTFYIPSRKAVPILRRIRKLPNGTVLYEKGMDIYKIGVKETFYLFKGFSKRNLQRNTNVQKVDLVYTWVNGRDPKWLNKFYNAVREEHIHIPRKHISTRFLDYEELKYSLRSVDLYLPWINKIYIVTASQIPEWLNTSHPKIRMISHEEIFPSEVKLPSFNSNAIEFSIGNIPGLSEHFIYANDDMFFGRPLIINDFFNEDGIPIIPYRKRKWSNPNIEFKIITFHNNKDDFAGFQFKAVTTNTACACESFFRRKMVGEYMHTPVPLTLSLFRRANGSFRKEIKSTIFSRFRSYKNYEMQLLMLLYGINTKLIAPVEITPDIASFVVVKKEGDIYLIPLTIKDPKFFCINVDLDKIRGKIQEWLEHRFPLKSSFEKCDYTLNSTVNNKTNFPNIYW